MLICVANNSFGPSAWLATLAGRSRGRVSVSPLIGRHQVGSRVASERWPWSCRLVWHLHLHRCNSLHSSQDPLAASWRRKQVRACESAAAAAAVAGGRLWPAQLSRAGLQIVAWSRQVAGPNRRRFVGTKFRPSEVVAVKFAFATGNQEPRRNLSIMSSRRLSVSALAADATPRLFANECQGRLLSAWLWQCFSGSCRSCCCCCCWLPSWRLVVGGGRQVSGADWGAARIGVDLCARPMPVGCKSFKIPPATHSVG